MSISASKLNSADNSWPVWTHKLAQFVEIRQIRIILISHTNAQND